MFFGTHCDINTHKHTKTAKQRSKTAEKTDDIKKTNDYLPASLSADRLTCYSQAYYCNAKDYTKN